MLKEILSISGKPGLYKKISNTATAIIVESLQDGRRFPAYASSKIVALHDISIYTTTGDLPLKTVLQRVARKENGGPAISHKESAAAVTAYVEEIVPEYDRDRVYLSDMRKVIQWYNILLDKQLLPADDEQEGEEKVEETPAAAPSPAREKAPAPARAPRQTIPAPRVAAAGRDKKGRGTTGVRRGE
jgi:hypothetical protein